MLSPRRAACLTSSLLLWAGALAGCASTDQSAGPIRAADTSAVGHDSPARIQRAAMLRVGMHQPQVLEWLGEPQHREPATNATGMRETWVYTIRHAPSYKTIVAEMEEVPYVDPFTGELKMLEEPVLNQQRIQILETITLIFRGPRMIDLSRETETRSTFRD
ncbi:hypothetical protein [Actomonas aquatica]|uniref:Lipoprotein SmpA/OmlA domain-containing protein n=1 Tax=Actomonas aquatica TaxID=2866162 RepID=A0ABZ1C2T3_9BACT|nr:hypothetical protein [Opitutus sp. WL0086]WRQ85791.1 hypothetical protein K1X11_013345 [Opitutus sp. WL0086]